MIYIYIYVYICICMCIYVTLLIHINVLYIQYILFAQSQHILDYYVLLYKCGLILPVNLNKNAFWFVWWFMPVIPEFWKQEQVNYGSDATLGCIDTPGSKKTNISAWQLVNIISTRKWVRKDTVFRFLVCLTCSCHEESGTEQRRSKYIENINTVLWLLFLAYPISELFVRKSKNCNHLTLLMLIFFILLQL
jgi:hypothetical protein